MTDLSLAGLDTRDVASDRHPYLHLAVLQGARPAGGLAARRTRTSRLTPGGLAQPPEVMGVDADVRVPNALQPMSGEFEPAGEVREGRPGFFGKLMPAPTGIANGVGVGANLGLRHVFGSPTGLLALGNDRFHRPGAWDRADLSGLTPPR